MRILLFIVLAMVSGAEAARTPVILVVGDSLSAAYGIDVDKGWVSLLDAQLRAQGYDCSVVNASISGDTTRGGRARLPRALERHQPALVIIELGANDGLRGIPIDEMQRNLASMIEASTDAGASVALLGMRIPTNYGHDYAEKFRNVYAKLAAHYELGYLPFLLDGVATDTRLLLDDGVHPNADAQPLLLDSVWKVVGPWVRGGGCDAQR